MHRAILLFSFYFVIATSITSPAQTFTKLADFDGTNGAYPTASLIQATDGNFYGTTYNGGSSDNCPGGCGTVFEITSDGTLTTLYSFCPQYGCADGSYSYAGLVQASDGNFYGTTERGGVNQVGTVYKITPEGVLTTLHSFDYADGDYPDAGLVQATDGNFYGTTVGGGGYGDGTVFKITPEGTLITLHSFDSTDGYFPYAGLVQGTDGNFYGTAFGGGANAYGTVFKITPGGTLTTLHDFNGEDGSFPVAGLVQATDGDFYGTADDGGTKDDGTVFKITPEGTLTTLHSFEGTDGHQPYASLVQATDGDFYGTTNTGGVNNDGTVFKITPEGTLSTLHSFDFTDGTRANGLVQARDGNFYGTTYLGGALDLGTVFKLSLPPVTLSVTKSGNGLVVSGDGHIYCGDVCSYMYLEGARAGLTAVPAPGYTFSSWTGCDNAQGDFCLMTMDGAKDVAATFTVSNVGLTSLVLNPSTVKGGNISIATITLNAPAPEGGLGVAVTSDQPLVVHPPSFVIVPGGRSSFSFAVRTTPVRGTTVANVTATANASQVSATLTVTPTYERLR